jgi:hypothetical protein
MAALVSASAQPNWPVLTGAPPVAGLAAVGAVVGTAFYPLPGLTLDQWQQVTSPRPPGLYQPSPPGLYQASPPGP